MESVVLRVLYHIAELFAFQLLRSIIEEVDFIRCYFNGVLKEINKAKDPTKYSRSARVSKVRGALLFDNTLSNSRRNFIATHERFVHPDYVLKDEASLYCVTDTEAFFVEAPPGVEIWRKKYGIFHKEAQHDHSIRLISMPISSFYKLADDLGRIKEKLIFVDFVPRSGSTLLGQIFENSGVCVNYSEPSILNDVWSCPDKEKMKRVLRAAVRFYAKPRKEETLAFFFKTMPMGRSLSQTLHELFPNASLFHLTRNPIPNYISLERANLAVALTRVVDVVRYIYPKIGYILMEDLGLNIMIDNKPAPPFVREVNDFMRIWSTVHYLYKKRMETVTYDMPAIKYEDLVGNKRANVAAIFKYCGLPADRVDAALTAFDSDSQEGSRVAQSKLCKERKPEKFFTELEMEKWQKLQGLFDLGSVYADFRMEGTITAPRKDSTILVTPQRHQAHASRNSSFHSIC